MALLFAVLPVFSLFTACNKATKGNSNALELHNRPYPLTLHKEKEYRFDLITKEGPFIGDTDDKDHIYAYFLQNQDNNCQVFKMNTDLEVEGTYIIRRAAGPGEAQNPRIYGGDSGGFIIVWDAPAHKYIKFDTNFRLIDEYRLNKQMGTFMYSGATYITRENMILDGFLQYDNYYDGFLRIFTLKITPDKKIKTVKLWETFKKTHRKDNDKYICGDPLNFGYYFDFIYILEKPHYRLIKMDLSGKIIKDIRISFKERTFPRDLRKEWIDTFCLDDEYCKRRFDLPEDLWPAVWLIQVGDGIAVARTDSYAPGPKRPIPADYFDRDLNYLGKIELPYFEFWNHPNTGQYHAFIKFLTKNGKLYFLETRADDDYWIIRYGIDTKHPL